MKLLRSIMRDCGFTIAADHLHPLPEQQVAQALLLWRYYQQTGQFHRFTTAL